jgi:uncharacterized protein
MVSERRYRAEGGTAGEAMRGNAGGFRGHFADIGAFRAANLNYWCAGAAERWLDALTEYAMGAGCQAGDESMTASPERLEGTVDPKLLEILVCPLTKGPLEFDAARQELISRSAKLAYPIRDGIPIMLPEEARKID